MEVVFAGDRKRHFYGSYVLHVIATRILAEDLIRIWSDKKLCYGSSRSQFFCQTLINGRLVHQMALASNVVSELSARWHQLVKK